MSIQKTEIWPFYKFFNFAKFILSKLLSELPISASKKLQLFCKKNVNNTIFTSANLFILMSSNSEYDLSFLILGFLRPKIGFLRSGGVGGGGQKKCLDSNFHFSQYFHIINGHMNMKSFFSFSAPKWPKLALLGMTHPQKF